MSVQAILHGQDFTQVHYITAGASIGATIGDYATAEGTNTAATMTAAHAEGMATTAGYAAHAEGRETTASGSGSHAEGRLTNATAANAHAEGYQSEASGSTSHAEGAGTTASGGNAHAEGRMTIADGPNAHAEGNQSRASGPNAHAEGYYAIASGPNAHAEGSGETGSVFLTGAANSTIYSYTTSDPTPSVGDILFLESTSGSVVQANSNQVTLSNTLSDTALTNATVVLIMPTNPSAATAPMAHAEGVSTEASALAAHAEGRDTKASGSGSHAEGRSTQATAANAHAEGYDTKASGPTSHAEGNGTEASGSNAHAEGRGTIASGPNQHVFGQYNMSNTVSVEIVGWGTASTPSNIRTLDTNGNEELAGNLTIKGTPSDNKHAVTKEYVDNKNISVNHGGTGKTTLTANALLYGNGTNAVKELSPQAGALYATGNIAPTFGVLPVTYGGTGATTTADFITASNIVDYDLAGSQTSRGSSVHICQFHTVGENALDIKQVGGSSITRLPSGAYLIAFGTMHTSKLSDFYLTNVNYLDNGTSSAPSVTTQVISGSVLAISPLGAAAATGYGFRIKLPTFTIGAITVSHAAGYILGPTNFTVAAKTV